jgi:hypothetical protein
MLIVDINRKIPSFSSLIYTVGLGQCGKVTDEKARPEHQPNRQ